MIRIFYKNSIFFHCVAFFLTVKKRAIWTKIIRSFPSPSSPSPSPSHQFLIVTGTYTDSKGGTSGVEFCIILGYWNPLQVENSMVSYNFYARSDPRSRKFAVPKSGGN